MLRVTATGTQSYGVRYRFAGQARRLHIGDVGRLSLAEARQQAREHLADVVKGTDPVATRDAAHQAAEEARRKTDRTIRRLAELWLSSRESKEWRPRTRLEFERIARR